MVDKSINRREKKLQGPYLTLQLASLKQAEKRYTMVSDHIAANTNMAVCPTGDDFMLIAGLTRLAFEYGIQIPGEPVLVQMVRLLTRVDIWVSEYAEHYQSARLLVIWLDKLLRRDVFNGGCELPQNDWLQLGTLELRCLGRLEHPWCDWCSGKIPVHLEHGEGFSQDLQIALQARVRGSFIVGLDWLIKQHSCNNTAMLLYGTLAGY